MTSGCFDILTHAHCKLLRVASQYGDELVVALNSDESIRRLKGVARPIVPYWQRASVLLAVKGVARVIALNDDEPSQLIRQWKPAFFIKAGGYTRATMPEWEAVEDCGGRVVLFGEFGGLSTTDIIKRCQNA
tara:strand:+ start:5063 stop:5458 length:396 start_codon:yes stop_codon:yes gene_type:complete